MLQVISSSIELFHLTIGEGTLGDAEIIPPNEEIAIWEDGRLHCIANLFRCVSHSFLFCCFISQ
jgi:hypothetical protein